MKKIFLIDKEDLNEKKEDQKKDGNEDDSEDGEKSGTARNNEKNNNLYLTEQSMLKKDRNKEKI